MEQIREITQIASVLVHEKTNGSLEHSISHQFSTQQAIPKLNE